MNVNVYTRDSGDFTLIPDSEVITVSLPAEVDREPEVLQAIEESGAEFKVLIITRESNE